MADEKKIIILVAGQTGCGKTTMANLISTGLAAAGFANTLVAEVQLPPTELEDRILALQQTGLHVIVQEAQLSREGAGAAVPVSVPKELVEP